MKSDVQKKKWDKQAPYWTIGLLIIGTAGLATIWFDLGTFWKGYVLDIAGPGWNYILFRGRFTAKKENVWTRFFTPIRTFLIFIIVAFGIEFVQFFKIYESTFDPWDFLAYITSLLPLFIIDYIQSTD
jgi:hypothetical protein